MQPPASNLFQSLGGNPRRVALMLVLVALAGLLWHRNSSGPGPAAADAVALVITSGEKMPAVPNLARGARLGAQQTQSPVPENIRNLFSSELNVPPPKPAEPAGTQQAQRDEDGLFWRQLQRALAERADREDYKRALADRVIRDAGKLTLSSVVMGPDPRALIATKLVGVGDQVSGAGESFTVVAIEPRRVVLARDGHRVSLVLGRPGADFVGGQ